MQANDVASSLSDAGVLNNDAELLARMSAELPASYFAVRDMFRHSHLTELDAKATQVLDLLLAEAWYKSGGHYEYGDLPAQADGWQVAGQEYLAWRSRLSLKSVSRALGQLEAAGAITRNRTGRVRHEADRISVLPIIQRMCDELVESPNATESPVAARAPFPLLQIVMQIMQMAT